jgi:hypothetical protein
MSHQCNILGVFSIREIFLTRTISTLFPRTAHERTVLFQSWRCHPDGNAAVDLVEWTGLEPSETLHHYSELIYLWKLVTDA